MNVERVMHMVSSAHCKKKEQFITFKMDAVLLYNNMLHLYLAMLVYVNIYYYSREYENEDSNCVSN